MRRYRGRNEMFRRVWWLQDGAPPHRRRIVFEGLEELFQDRVIALNRQVEWPPRSPDLTPLDFFLWGYLKSKVYQTPPVSLDDLEERIRRELDILKQDRAMVRRAVGDMLRRARLCRDGGHVEEWNVHRSFQWWGSTHKKADVTNEQSYLSIFICLCKWNFEEC